MRLRWGLGDIIHFVYPIYKYYEHYGKKVDLIMTKVDIFSGFLGAGKTTLIRKLIAEGYDSSNIVLIENEFGEIGVDTGFLRESGIKINEMTAGCICCTLVGDFSRALNEVIEKYEPERVLIEPSGVGKLSDVIIAVQDADNDRIELNGFTTVVDAKRYDTYMRNFGEFYRNQVEHASSVFLSHQQGMEPAAIEELVKKIRELNPDATIVTTDWDQLSGKKILETMEKKQTLSAELDKLREEAYEEMEAHEHHHHHHNDDEEDGECGCEHHHHHHHHHGHSADEIFDEVGTQTANKFTRAELENILDSMDECGEVLRAKGIVECSDGGWLEFDYVPGEGELRETSAEAAGMIVVIGTRLNRDKISKLFRLA